MEAARQAAVCGVNTLQVGARLDLKGAVQVWFGRTQWPPQEQPPPQPPPSDA